MKLNKSWGAFMFIVILSACGLDQYNNSSPDKITDRRANSIYVYGEKGDSARQLRTQYPKPEDADARAKAIREKFFGDSNGSNSQETGTAAPAQDSTKKTEPAKDSVAAKKA